jgi:hypothetical protein
MEKNKSATGPKLAVARLFGPELSRPKVTDWAALGQDGAARSGHWRCSRGAAWPAAVRGALPAAHSGAGSGRGSKMEGRQTGKPHRRSGSSRRRHGWRRLAAGWNSMVTLEVVAGMGGRQGRAAGGDGDELQRSCNSREEGLGPGVEQNQREIREGGSPVRKGDGRAHRTREWRGGTWLQ